MALPFTSLALPGGAHSSAGVTPVDVVGSTGELVAVVSAMPPERTLELEAVGVVPPPIGVEAGAQLTFARFFFAAVAVEGTRATAATASRANNPYIILFVL